MAILSDKMKREMEEGFDRLKESVRGMCDVMEKSVMVFISYHVIRLKGNGRAAVGINTKTPLGRDTIRLYAQRMEELGIRFFAVHNVATGRPMDELVWTLEQAVKEEAERYAERARRAGFPAGGLYIVKDVTEDCLLKYNEKKQG